MKSRLLFLLALFTLACSAAVPAVERQATAPIVSVVQAFLARETAGLPGRAAYQVGSVDPLLNVPQCRTLEAFTPPGGRLWGSANVGVRCSGGPSWVLYVPVEIQVFADVVHAAKPIAQNHIVTEADLVLQSADLTRLPSGILTDIRSAVGRMMTVSLAAGLPLRADILRAPPVIQQGQSVKLVLQGRGFTVTAEGRALTGAADGQSVPVRVQSGQVVNGLARAGGVVELHP